MTSGFSRTSLSIVVAAIRKLVERLGWPVRLHFEVAETGVASGRVFSVDRGIRLVAREAIEQREGAFEVKPSLDRPGPPHPQDSDVEVLLAEFRPDRDIDRRNLNQALQYLQRPIEQLLPSAGLPEFDEYSPL